MLIDKNHPPAMLLLRIGICWAILLSLYSWLAISPMIAMFIALAISVMISSWTEWIYWQLVISWQLLVSRFKP